MNKPMSVGKKWAMVSEICERQSGGYEMSVVSEICERQSGGYEMSVVYTASLVSVISHYCYCYFAHKFNRA